MVAAQRHLWIGNSFALRYFAGAAFAITAVFVSLKPQASENLGAFTSVVFWLFQNILALSLLVGAQLLLSRIFPGSRHPWTLTTAAGVLGAVLFSFPAYLLDELLALNEHGEVFWDGILDELHGVFFPVVATWLALNAPWILKLDFTTPEALPGASAAVSEEAPDHPCGDPIKGPVEDTLLAQLHVEMHELEALSSELHYLRVFYRNRSSLVLYSLRDAVAELPPELGVQIHRSHWIARRHFQSFEEKSGTLFCRMHSGLLFPVSRRKRVATRKALQHTPAT